MKKAKKTSPSKASPKKAVKKKPSKASHKKAVRNLEVKPAKGGTVRGGSAEKWIEIQSYSFSHQNRIKP